MHDRCTNDAKLLLSQRFCRRGSTEEEVKAPANCPVYDAIWAQKPLLTVKVASIHDVRFGRTKTVASLKIDGVGRVHSGVDRLIIHFVVLIPESLRVLVWQAKAPAYCFWQSVNIVVGYHVRHELRELVLEDDLVASGIGGCLARRRSLDSELKSWIVAPLESQITCMGRASFANLSAMA